MATTTDLMHQVAPYPHDLAELVRTLRYRRHLGWSVRLDHDFQRDQPGRHTGESRGLTLIVTRCGANTYDPDEPMTVNHYFAVPAATYNRQSWLRWLFDRLADVDTHERMEDFAFTDDSMPELHDKCACGHPAVAHDGRNSSCDGCGDTNRHRFQAETPRLVRPYAPCHGPGWDPYLITVERTETDRRTSFRGELNDH